LLLWPEKPYKFWFYIGSIGALYLLALGCGMVSRIPSLLGLHDNRVIMQRTLRLIDRNTALLVFSAITAGFTEELIFRGYMVPRLELLFKNKYMPVLISAALFSAIHYRYFSLTEIIFTFLLGVVFAVYYQMYRNIKVLIITHAIIDLIAFLLFRFVQTHHLHY
jgi:membrane protease YdiL (CAAX protease family)